ncbi:hypothetical protein ElyMa_004553600 [Elysia marginata]|uniref:Uncharacterized protein n=1 Tax=Elysia marginata TaxID=1093978 RepID=A0AAV4HUP3_9GAST|nr:hypothetical protein ElyMa_004553600 [Elysia marginata]
MRIGDDDDGDSNNVTIETTKTDRECSNPPQESIEKTTPPPQPASSQNSTTAHHQRCSTPLVVFPNAICLVSFTASSPYMYMAISMVNAELRFVTEYNTSPLDAIPRGMFLGPWRTMVTETLGQDEADVWATST